MRNHSQLNTLIVLCLWNTLTDCDLTSTQERVNKYFLPFCIAALLQELAAHHSTITGRNLDSQWYTFWNSGYVIEKFSLLKKLSELIFFVLPIDANRKCAHYLKKLPLYFSPQRNCIIYIFLFLFFLISEPHKRIKPHFNSMNWEYEIFKWVLLHF